MGIASRREAERWIEGGLVSVNGEIVREMGVRINPDEDQVTVKGKLIVNKAPPKVYWLLNKPDQILTARTDDRDRETIYDLPKLRNLPYLVSPVGRLDYRTEGLLLLTNDGELANRLCHPKYKVPRSYYALVNRKLTDQELEKIREGIKLEDGLTKDIKINFSTGMKMGASKGFCYDIIVTEGRNRLVRRIFEHFDIKVVRLMRYAFGDIFLPPELEISEYTQLHPDQIYALKKSTGL
jgi:23S rRNA pseudouridine2605 synthase